MKRLNKNIIVLLTLVFLLPCYYGLAQEKGDLSVALSYYIKNNQVPYVKVAVKTKIDGRFKPVEGISLNLFLGSEGTANKIGTVITGEKGDGIAFIPQSLKKLWSDSVKHTFLATFDGNKKFSAAKADLTVSPAKILMTTADKSITATVLEKKDAAWVPVKGVELKIAIRRMGGDLPVNETPTFTTDSTGTTSADFKRDSIPGGASGNITLVAKVEDNDTYGNLSIEKIVPWGVKFIPVNTFDRRTLFATRDKAPIWLEFIAYSIIIAVWGILISLVFNIVKIYKLGKKA